MHQAIGSSAAIGFPIAAGGLIGYIVAGATEADLPSGSYGYIYLPALIACSLASLLTAQFGAKTAHRMQVASLKKAFAYLLVILALYMGTLAF
jgi:uncharacterized membrane protein YfcA